MSVLGKYRKYLSNWNRDYRERTFVRVSDTLRFPMVFLAILYLPVAISGLGSIGIPVPSVAPAARPWINGLELVIRSAFVAEYGVLLLLSPQRLSFIRSHLLELTALLLPSVRLLRVALAFILLTRVLVATRTLATRALAITAIVFSMTILTSAIFVFAWESEHPQAQIQSFSDALWWALVTAATVGYGDLTPVTAAGRLAAATLMFAGIASMTALTAALAAALVEHNRKPGPNGQRE